MNYRTVPTSPESNNFLIFLAVSGFRMCRWNKAGSPHSCRMRCMVGSISSSLSSGSLRTLTGAYRSMIADTVGRYEILGGSGRGDCVREEGRGCEESYTWHPTATKASRLKKGKEECIEYVVETATITNQRLSLANKTYFLHLCGICIIWNCLGGGAAATAATNTAAATAAATVVDDINYICMRV